MRILANENVSATVIQALRQRGHDVVSVKESLRGEKDPAILARAQHRRHAAAGAVDAQFQLGVTAVSHGIPGVFFARASADEISAGVTAVEAAGVEGNANASGGPEDSQVWNGFHNDYEIMMGMPLN